MNIPAMKKLAKLLYNLPKDEFNMSIWANWTTGYYFSRPVCSEDLHTCGTTCCIGGYQVLQTPGRCITDLRVYPIDSAVAMGRVQDVAAEELGLSHQQSEVLFFSPDWPFNPKTGKIFPETPRGAAARLRYMIETGK